MQSLDGCLRQALGIFEYCTERDCVLRIARRRSLLDILLPDGTEIRRGDDVIELHFWNENLPTVASRRSLFGWGVRFRNRMHNSLALLARYAAEDPDVETAKAFYARLVFPLAGRFRKCAAVAEHYGFTLVRPKQSVARGVHDLLENLLMYALCLAFNPGKAKRRTSLQRVHWWISREHLLARYQAGSESGGRGGNAEPAVSETGEVCV